MYSNISDSASSRIDFSLGDFLLQTTEEGFSYRIVITIASAAHARDQTVMFSKLNGSDGNS
jgi:hypothetical protein